MSPEARRRLLALLRSTDGLTYGPRWQRALGIARSLADGDEADREIAELIDRGDWPIVYEVLEDADAEAFKFAALDLLSEAPLAA